MASEMSPAAEQQKTLLAQHNKRLMWRLAAWGGAAAFSLAAAVIVSQTGPGNKRLQVAVFGSGQPYHIAPSMASTTVPLPPADLIAVKRMTETIRRSTERTAARLETVAQHTAESRAETKRLAMQVGKLRADSLRVTGRLASIETQVGSITGSIRKHAEDAAAAAVAKAIPPKPAFDVTAPVISSPATLYPKLSLIVPQAPPSAASRMTADWPRTADETGSGQQTKPDVSVTSSITNAGSRASGIEGKAEPKAGRTSQASPKPEELTAGVAVETKAAPGSKHQLALKPEAKGKPMAKSDQKTRLDGAQISPTEKMVTGSIPMRRRIPSQHWIPTNGYGVDLGGAESVTVAKAQWAAVKANFGPMLVGMRPVVVRNHRLLTTGDYRLVVGQTNSLAAAEKLCNRLALQQINCQPVEFEDGRMVWR